MTLIRLFRGCSGGDCVGCSGAGGPGFEAAGALLLREGGAAGVGGGGGLVAAEPAASRAEERVTLEDMRFYLLDFVQSMCSARPGRSSCRKWMVEAREEKLSESDRRPASNTQE